jgi:hypothetical protein
MTDIREPGPFNRSPDDPPQPGFTPDNVDSRE